MTESHDCSESNVEMNAALFMKSKYLFHANIGFLLFNHSVTLTHYHQIISLFRAAYGA